MRKSFLLCGFWIMALFFTKPAFSADIHLAISSGDIEKVRSILISNPRQVGVRDKSPLDVESSKMSQYAEILRFDFIFNTIKPDVYYLDMKSYTPLMLAVVEQNRDMVDLLIAFGANVNDINKDGLNCIHLAAIGGDLEIFERLLVQKYKSLETRDFYGFTPLALAAAIGNLDILDFLVKKGLDVNTQDRNGITPLMYAVLGNHIAITEILVEAGAKINERDKIGNTALMYAAFTGNTGIIAYLLSNGSDLDPKNKRGVTPLIYAVISGEFRTARFLIQRGANSKDTLGQELFIDRIKKRYPKGAGLLQIAQINVDNDMINLVTMGF